MARDFIEIESSVCSFFVLVGAHDVFKYSIHWPSPFYCRVVTTILRGGHSLFLEFYDTNIWDIIGCGASPCNSAMKCNKSEPNQAVLAAFRSLFLHFVAEPTEARSLFLHFIARIGAAAQHKPGAAGEINPASLVFSRALVVACGANW